jgi:F0F1-type ATP synthase gamma subunit
MAVKCTALPACVRAQVLYNAMLENNCSEHASRMSAMENSSKSAGEILGKLTLMYNRCEACACIDCLGPWGLMCAVLFGLCCRKRQASITTELIEIIAGASALVDAE